MTRQAPKTVLSFNDLLSLFEAYLDTLIEPLLHVVHKVQEDGDIDKGEIVCRLTRHSQDASQMSKKLQSLRAAHNAGSDITVTLSAEETRRLELATAEVPYLFGHAENIFDLLYRGLSSGFLVDDPGMISLLEICSRTFKAAAANEGEAVAMFDHKLRTEMKHLATAELIRDGAIPAPKGEV
jgi:hypothetical protein